MRKIAVIAVTILLVSVIALQVLAALNIFPREQRVPVCPVDAISMQGGKAVIDASKCIGCRRCVAGICPPTEIVRDTVFVNPTAVPGDESGKTRPSALVEQFPAKADHTVPKPAQPEPKETLFQVSSGQCVGCGLCTIYCPTGAITMVGDKAVIDQTKCIDCGICKTGNSQDFKGCPFNAITGP